MSTGTHNRPNGSISQEQLLAYAEGRITSREQFEMELLMETDPLLEEAAEGLALPGAIEGLEKLDKSRPGNGGNNGMIWSMSVVIVVVSIGAGIWMMSSNEQEDPIIMHEQHQHATTADDVPLNGVDQPMTEVPIQDPTMETEQIVETRPTEAFRREPVQVAAPVQREQPTERISALPVEPETIRTAVVPRPLMPRDRKSGRQLHYLHDLKLIHPQELYGTDPLLQMDPVNVPASQADRDRPANTELRTMEYLDFMDEALAHFVRNDHDRCLEELRFLLAQYPDDVNALFYSGLSNFHTGRYRAAESQLKRAAGHQIDVFREEALWYRAQTLERSGDVEAAHKEYSRISERGGFYAERARQRLK